MLRKCLFPEIELWPRISSCFRYYYDNQDVKNDKEFRNYLNELSTDGSFFFHGRIGKVILQSHIADKLFCLFSAVASSSCRTTNLKARWLCSP